MPGSDAQQPPTSAAIVLAGGRGSRLGGTSKALLRISGRPALARVVEALLEAHRSVVAVVGPAGEVDAALRHDPAVEQEAAQELRRARRPDSAADSKSVPDHASAADTARPPDDRGERVRIAIEDDRFGGPAVAVDAGVDALVEAGVPGEALVDLVPCDLVHPTELVAALDEATSGVELTEGAAVGVMLVDRDGHDQWLATRIRLGALSRALAGVAAGDSLRGRLGGLELVRVAAPDGATLDIDTPADVAAYGAVVHPGQWPLCL